MDLQCSKAVSTLSVDNVVNDLFCNNQTVHIFPEEYTFICITDLLFNFFSNNIVEISNGFDIDYQFKIMR